MWSNKRKVLIGNACVTTGKNVSLRRVDGLALL